MKVNFMNIKMIICIVSLSLSAPLFAAPGDVTSQGYEISLSNFTAPATANGGVTFKECDDCNRRTVRVVSGTRYAINGKTVRLEDFRKAILQVPDREAASLTVLHHIESDTIELIDLVY
jgi:hypothetical protein